MLQSYGFIGVLESLSSFAMSYWYLQRSGIPFSALWFKYGAVPDKVTEDYYNARLAEASSIYVNLQPNVPPHPPPEHLPASPRLQQADQEFAAVPSDPVCSLYGYLLALHPATTDCVGDFESADGAFLPTCGFWVGGFVAG